jgi:hypothetical protein
MLKQVVHVEPLDIGGQSADTVLPLPYQLLGAEKAGKGR